MALYNLIKKKRKEKRRKLVKTATISTVVAGTIGAVSGLLLAQKSGKETIEDIKEKVDEVKAKSIDQSKKLKSNIEEAGIKIKDYLKEKKLVDNSSDYVIVSENDVIEEKEEINDVE